MRFVPVNCIRDGMISSRKVMGKNGELLLNNGSEIYFSYVEKLKELGYIGVYVDDDVSADIEITEVVSQSLRFKTVRSIKNAFIMLESGKEISRDNIESIYSLVNEITENILSNRTLMVNLIDLKVFDDYTYYHSVNVGILSIMVGTSLSLNKDQLCKLGLASMLHDIGKVFVPKEILNKPDKLSNDEFQAVKAHPFRGYEYLSKYFDMPVAVSSGVLQHHERHNGSGYPAGIKGDKISLFGKIIAVADVYDALTSKRPYRDPIVPSESIEYIMGGCGSMFDPDIVEVFLKKIAPYPVGTSVSMSNGMTGLVSENYSDCSLRPRVKVIKHGDADVEPYFIDLRSDMNTLNITITGLADGGFSSEYPEKIDETA